MSRTRFEMHFHTKESSPCGKVPAKTGVDLYQKAGFNGIVVTDHFSKSVYGGPEGEDWEEICNKFLRGYHLAKDAAKESDFQIFLGMEIRFPHDENDFLLYGINEEFVRRNPWIYMEELDRLYEIARKENLLIVQAHPFRNNCFLASVELLHGIEVFNGNPNHDSRNDLAAEAAKRHNLIKIIGSDFHRIGDISDKRFELEGMPISEQELVMLIKSK
ncbi:MAG: hypothetical protein K0R92_2146 [Lachnospiraceae bacterium]|jgi:histidinol phosphatase-like PHP family hydrolase|nr:hypothetical protein [Lachnospiraceae bacterium]